MVNDCWDSQELSSRCLGNLALVELLLEGFRGRLPLTVEEMQAALQSDDAIKARQLAHRLKGEAANLSAKQIQQAAATMEVVAREGDLTDLQVALESVMDACQTFKKHVASRNSTL